MQAGRGGAVTFARIADPEVDEPSPEVGLVHPARHPGVVRVRHQERQAEATQQPLRRAFPVAFLLAHLLELAGKRHLHLRRDPERLAQRGAHGNLPGGNVAAPCPQAPNLPGEGVVLLLAAAKAHLVLGQIVLQRLVARAEDSRQVHEPPSLREKLRVVPGRALAAVSSISITSPAGGASRTATAFDSMPCRMSMMRRFSIHARSSRKRRNCCESPATVRCA